VLSLLWLRVSGWLLGGYFGEYLPVPKNVAKQAVRRSWYCMFDRIFKASLGLLAGNGNGIYD
jgi:hypothetical protein